jgi:hypothetical protein
MKVHFLRVEDKEEEGRYLQMEMYMKENGLRELSMVKELLLVIKTVLHILELGRFLNQIKKV